MGVLWNVRLQILRHWFTEPVSITAKKCYREARLDVNTTGNFTASFDLHQAWTTAYLATPMATVARSGAYRFLQWEKPKLIQLPPLLNDPFTHVPPIISKIGGWRGHGPMTPPYIRHWLRAHAWVPRHKRNHVISSVNNRQVNQWKIIVTSKLPNLFHFNK